jgi:hypothetical protein
MAIVLCLVFVMMGVTSSVAGPRPGSELLGDSNYWLQPRPPTGGEAGRDDFYCQPLGTLSSPLNASTAWGRELADDIPTVLAGQWVYSITIYVEEWLGLWQDPLGVYAHFYSGVCAPPLAPDESRYFPWGDPAAMETELVWTNPDGTASRYRVKLWMCPAVWIESPMSIGFQVDTDWGQDPPYAGLTLTPEGESYGCGGAYWDGNPDHPRWTAVADLPWNDAPQDLVFCLGEFGGPSAVDEATWSSIKSLYR